jgi:dienelactone hydrolase
MTPNTTALLLSVVLLLCSAQAVPGAGSPTPPELWKDYDPNKGDFKEEIIKQEVREGILSREAYISAYVLGEEIRVYCKYSVKEGAKLSPGLLSVHGWMGAPGISKDFVEEGWAVLAHDYCGKTGERPHYTKYPQSLWHGNMDRNVAGPVNTTTAEGKDITDPKQTSDYLWYAIQRRALSYLEQQKEVDRSRLGASGYSYGGTLMWNLATDPRVKAVVPHFGIGYNDYYRNRRVWMYNVPYTEPPKTAGEEIYLRSVAPEAHVPYITAATLFLNGSNDHHGGHERQVRVHQRVRPPSL